jgi:uncharacterized protein YqiB (DUF1249 family)
MFTEFFKSTSKAYSSHVAMVPASPIVPYLDTTSAMAEASNVGIWRTSAGTTVSASGSLLQLRNTIRTNRPSAKRTKSRILSRIRERFSYKVFKKPQQMETSSKHETAILESLPTEIQLSIIQQLPNVDSLRALSLASRTFNDVRILHKNVVLPQVLMREMGEVNFEEAYWVVRARQAGFDTSNYHVKINNFLSQWLEFEPGSLDASSIHPSDIIKISDLHRRVLHLVGDFCAYTMSGDDINVQRVPSLPQLSFSELARITRAFYRFELYFNLYRDPVQAETHSTNKVFEVRQQSYTFFNSWPAWEAEEIACIRDYFFARLTDVFANIQRAAAMSPLEVHVYHRSERKPQDLPENAVAFCADIIPPWYDDTAPSGATFLPDGELAPY